MAEKSGAKFLPSNDKNNNTSEVIASVLLFIYLLMRKFILFTDEFTFKKRFKISGSK